MKGFVITFRNKEYKIGIENGSSNIIIGRVATRDENYINLGGLEIKDDSEIAEHIYHKWLDATLEDNDEIIIRFQDIDQISESTKKVRKQGETVTEAKIRHYHKLKKELEEGGHI